MESWIQITPKTGQGNSQIHIDVEASTEDFPRHENVTIKTNDNTIKDFIISQKGIKDMNIWILDAGSSTSNIQSVTRNGVNVPIDSQLPGILSSEIGQKKTPLIYLRKEGTLVQQVHYHPAFCFTTSFIYFLDVVDNGIFKVQITPKLPMTTQK